MFRVRFGILGTTAVWRDDGSEVAVGDPMVRWDPSTVPDSASGQAISTVVPVVVMDAPRGSVISEALGQPVKAGDLLFATS